MRQSSYTLTDMGKIVSLCKRRGFIFPSSEIYGGFGNFWDYGPLGVLLKTNVKAAWFRTVVQERDDVIPLDSTIIMHPRIWEASGHVQNFTDPLVDCKKCGKRWRADNLEDGHCPECGGDVTEIRQFNLMFKTYVGPVADEASIAYLRPETAQGIFANFKSAMTALRMRPPFGIAQIGKAFRNEITPGNFTFRTREFEQMELEFFIMPGTDAQWFEYWVAQRRAWYEQYGIRGDKLRLYEHPKEALAHYSRGTFDVEYEFPFGWGELEGIANRGDYDLAQHEQFSGEELRYFVEESKQHIRPEVIEPSAGADRATLAFLLDAYDEEPDGNETRVVLRFHPALAPYKAAILPLQRKPDLIALANSIRSGIRNRFMTAYDETGSIGRRYRRQDEIGTPFCVTPDFQSLEDHAVTVRDRDDMTQERIPIADLGDWLEKQIARGIGRAGPRDDTGAQAPRGTALVMGPTTTQSSVLIAQSSTKWVYLFEEGSASMRALLGGKGAGCAEMTRAGLPVPPGFTITTEACNAYYSVGKQFPGGMWEQVLTALRSIEEKTGKKLGDPSNPLLVSVRSGAAFSMPGMMDTVLNLGLNDETAAGLARLMENDRFAQDAYRRFIQMYGRIVMGIDARAFDEKLDAAKDRHKAKADTDLDANALNGIVGEFKEVVRRQAGRDFPVDPLDQLRLAIGAVFSSWMGDRAVVYREAAKIPHDLGTAVNVQTMVFRRCTETSS
ncbi:MAG: glycyl-tRNA synthetase [Chloroflexi bacterium]|nr:glycyl-tRNA synthetase [Chloroflexota bacterium]